MISDSTTVTITDSVPFQCEYLLPCGRCEKFGIKCEALKPISYNDKIDNGYDDSIMIGNATAKKIMQDLLSSSTYVHPYGDYDSAQIPF